MPVTATSKGLIPYPRATVELVVDLDSKDNGASLMQPPTSRAWQDGGSVLHYRISGQLGAGGQGVVYRAYDTKLERPVALKVLAPDARLDQVHRSRFLREAITISTLDHPNIGTVHALEETPEGENFIVMTCYEGRDVRTCLREGRLAPFDALGIALQIAQGLRAAHEAGIVHRDLKPSNMILTPQGILKLIDFGLAKSDAAGELTEVGVRMGTLSYMSPEQAMGGAVDHRTDLWALGVILFEMLTGHLPFRGSNSQATLYGIVNEPVPPMPGISASFHAVVQRALAKDPELRFQSAAEMLKALEAIREEAVDATAPMPELESSPPMQVSVPPQRRIPWVKIAVAAALLAVTVAATVAWKSVDWARTQHPSKYLAVLPIRTDSSDPTQHALAGGWTNSLTEGLRRYEASNPDLLVVPQADVNAGSIEDVAQARFKFGVERVIVGDVSMQGALVHLALNLIDAAKLTPLGSVSVEGDLNGLSTINAQAIEQIAGLLELQASQTPAPPSPKAYASWLRGVGFLEDGSVPGNLQLAIDEFKRGLDISPDARLLASLAKAYVARYEKTKDVAWLKSARETVAEGIELDSNLAANYLNRGAIRNLESDYNAAAADFQQALLLDGRSDEAYRGLARAYDGMNLPNRAEETFKKAIAVRPGSWSGYNRLGGFYYRHQRYQEAAEQYQKVVELNPGNFEGYNNLGSMLKQIGRLDEARAALEKSVNLTPNVPAYNNLANLFLREKRYAEASSAFDKALEIDDHDYVLWANLAAAHLRTPGRRSQAMDAYQRAVTLAEAIRRDAPDNAIVLADLATYYALLGKRTEPLEYIHKALVLAPAESDILIAAAETYELMGFRTDAVDYLSKGLRAGYPWQDIEQAVAFEDLLKDRRFSETFQSFRKK